MNERAEIMFEIDIPSPPAFGRSIEAIDDLSTGILL
jgi:hypothetical protein